MRAHGHSELVLRCAKVCVRLADAPPGLLEVQDSRFQAKWRKRNEVRILQRGSAGG